MRLIGAMIVLALFASGPAAAQTWKEYNYPQYFFAVSFPEAPKAEDATYDGPGGIKAPARVYSVKRDNGLFSMTIVDFSDAKTDEDAVIANAVKNLSQGGEVKLDIPHRISAVYGRQLSIAGSDGRHASVALFFNRQRLYQIEGVALPNGEDATADAIRFQQSLVFTNAGANRSLFEPVFQVVGRFFGNE